MEQGREAHCSTEETFTAEYKMMMTLGQGQFSEVKLAFHIPTVSCVAVKICRHQKYASLIKSEINIMKSLAHPNIIKLFHVVQTRETTYLVMEHASEGDLLHHVLELGSLEESEARRLFTQILHAVQYCHDKFIIHRDIKADNILLDHRGNAKLCDFGLSAKVIPGQKLSGFCGTLNYCAPELFGKEAYDGRTTDIWSLGVLLFFMVTGRFPFKAHSAVRVIQQILTANFRVPPHVSVDIRDLILKLLIINPYRRLTIGQIMRHPMVRNSEACLPATSPHSLPGTPSPGIVRPMAVMGYKSEEITESLRDQKYSQVIATYLILQHQSPGGDGFHHQEKPVRAMQSGLVLNLADLHTFPLSLGRATKPARPTFTLPSKTSEKEERNARQGGTRHSMSAALCCQPKKTHPPHLPHLGCPVADSLVGSNLEITEYFTQTEIGSLSSHMASVQPPLFLDTTSPRPHQSESTGDTDNNVSSCSPQEELCSSQEASQYFTPTGSSPWDTLQEETMNQDEAITHEATKTQEGTMTQDETITHEVTKTQEGTITQDEAIIHEATKTQEGTMTQDEAITHAATMTQEGTMTQDEAIIHEATKTQEGTMTHDKAIIHEATKTQEGTMTQDEAIIHEATKTQEGTMTQDEAITHAATMTQEGTITQDEAITHEVTKTQEGTITQDEAIIHEATKTQEGTMTQDKAIIHEATKTQEGTMTQDEAIIHEATKTQEGTMTQDEAITHAATITHGSTMTHDEAITHEATKTQEGTMTQDEAITHAATITQEGTMTQDEAIIHEATKTQEGTMTQDEAIIHEATKTQEGTMTQDEAITHAATMTHDEAITHEATKTQEQTMTQDLDVIQDATITPEATMTQEATIRQEEAITLDMAMTQEVTITHGQPQDAGPASSRTQRRHSWKVVKKTIMNCLRQLCCCCLPPANIGRTSCKNLAPKKRNHGVTPRTSPEEVKSQLNGL